MAVVLSDKPVGNQTASNDPFSSAGGFRLGHSLSRRVDFQLGGKTVTASVAYQGGDSYAVKVETGSEGAPIFTVRGGLEAAEEEGRTELVVAVDGVVSRQGVLVKDDKVLLYSADGAVNFPLRLPKFVSEAGGDGEGGGMGGDAAVAPMPGTVELVSVKPGDKVQKGQPLATMIAMKMEYVLKAARDGEVDRVAHGPGDAVKKGTPIVVLKKQE